MIKKNTANIRAHNSDPVIRLEGVSKDYRIGRHQLRVLDDVDISLERGELLCIEGPSGAGKSTLLHIMGILDTPTEGSVIYEGIDIAGLNDKKRASRRNKLFGFVFQFYHLLPDLSAVENVALPALAGLGIKRWMRGRKKAIEKGRRALDIVGLKDRCKHRPTQLSGGERQRVAIARALINDPEILLCDEPTGNLDTASSEDILELLCRLQRELNTTLVIVTHDKHVAERAQRKIYMEDGRVVENV